VDLLNDESGYVRVYADRDGFGHELSMYAPRPMADLSKMSGYWSELQEAARYQRPDKPAQTASAESHQDAGVHDCRSRQLTSSTPTRSFRSKLLAKTERDYLDSRPRVPPGARGGQRTLASAG
jgi:hypothetical protein